MKTPEAKTYSISQASQLLGKSQSSIKGYKKLVLEAFKKDSAQVVEPNGMLTEYGLEQLRKAAHFIARSNPEGYLKAIFQANPDLEFDLSGQGQPTQPVSGNAQYTGVLRGGSLVTRKQVIENSGLAAFDQAGSDAELAAIERDAEQQVGNLSRLFSAYGKSKVRRALARIDATVEALEANAYQEMGVTANAPKSSDATA